MAPLQRLSRGGAGGGIRGRCGQVLPICHPSDHESVGIHADHELHRLGHGAESFGRRADGRLHSRRRIFSEQRPDLCEAVAERRIGAADQRGDAEVRARVHARRRADRLYLAAELDRLGHVDCADTGRSADPAAAERLGPHVAGRASRVVLRDQNWPPHGDRDRHRFPRRIAGDLFPCARACDGALLIRVAERPIRARRRDGSQRRMGAVPSRGAERRRRGARRWAARLVPVGCLVAGWQMDVLRCAGPGRRASVAAAISRRDARADHLRAHGRNRHRHRP